MAGKEPGFAAPKSGRQQGTTIEQLAKLWASGELAREYPDHVRVKKTSADDVRVFAWLSKVRMPCESREAEPSDRDVDGRRKLLLAHRDA